MFVPLEQALKPEHFDLVTTEIFGPFQVRARGATPAPWRTPPNTRTHDPLAFCRLPRSVCDTPCASPVRFPHPSPPLPPPRGVLQVVTEYTDAQLPLVLEALERMSHHLTAAVVSNDVGFVQHVLAHSVNGTTYAGIRARTTGEFCPRRATLPPRPDSLRTAQRSATPRPLVVVCRRAAEPLVWAGGRPTWRRHRHAGGHPARVVVPPRDHQRLGATAACLVPQDLLTRRVLSRLCLFAHLFWPLVLQHGCRARSRAHLPRSSRLNSLIFLSLVIILAESRRCSRREESLLSS